MVSTNGVHEDVGQKVGKKRRGFQFPVKTAHLTFEGEHEGAEVWIRINVSFGDFLKLQQKNAEDGHEEQLRQFGEGCLVSWNLERDDGTEIPANGDGMMELPVDFATLLISEWVTATTGVPDPLEQGSDDLSTLAEASTVLGDQ